MPDTITLIDDAERQVLGTMPLPRKPMYVERETTILEDCAAVVDLAARMRAHVDDLVRLADETDAWFRGCAERAARQALLRRCGVRPADVEAV